MTNRLRPYTIVPQDLYVAREADRQLENSIRDMGRPPYVLVARQMGKTNLLLNAKRNLPTGDDIFVYIDMSNAFSSSRECFRNIIDRTIDTNDGQISHLFNEILANRADNKLSPHSEHGRELRMCLRAIKGKIVIILDEIDALTKSTFSDEIFSQIRSIYFERVNFPEYERLTYVLSGVAEPNEIIKNAKISPFNIGQKIFLNDFSGDEVAEFLQRAGIGIEPEMIEYLYTWTKGNPRMTWDVCAKLEEDMIQGITLTKEIIDSTINDLYLKSYDRPPVDHIRDLVSQDLAIRNAIVEIKYGKGDQISDSVRRKLYLAGIINSNSLSGSAYLKNKIIELALSDKWLKDVTNQTKDFLTKGNEAFEKADFSEALINFRHYLENNPTNIPEIFNWKFAICCLRTNQYQEAITYFDLFDISKTQFEDIYLQKMHMKGLCYAFLNLPNDSRQCFKEVVRSNRINYHYYDSRLSLLYLETVLNSEYSPLSLKDEALILLEDYETNKDKFSNAQYVDLVFSTYYSIATFYKEAGEEENAKIFARKSLEHAPIETHPKLLLWLYDLEPTEENIQALVTLIIQNQLKPYQFDPTNPHLFTSVVLNSILIEAYKKSIFEYNRLCSYMIVEVYAEGISQPMYELFLVEYINQYHTKERLTGIRIAENLLQSDHAATDSSFVFSVVRQLALSNSKVTDYDRRYLEGVKNDPDIINYNVQDLTLFAKNILSQINTKQFVKALSLVNLALSFSDKFEQHDFNLAILHYYRLLIFNNLGDRVEAVKSANKVLTLLSNSSIKKNLLAEREYQLVQNEALSTLRVSMSKPILKTKKYSRNDRVRVRYLDGSETEGKYKKFELDLLNGQCTIVEAGN